MWRAFKEWVKAPIVAWRVFWKYGRDGRKAYYYYMGLIEMGLSITPETLMRIVEMGEDKNDKDR